ncbi:hypothetical protein [Niabella aquatica]
MKTKIIFSSSDGGVACAAGKCPTVYQTENGNYLFQGFKLENISEISDISEDETIIELPKEFVEKFIEKMK